MAIDGIRPPRLKSTTAGWFAPVPFPTVERDNEGQVLRPGFLLGAPSTQPKCADNSQAATDLRPLGATSIFMRGAPGISV
ncbi:hypothetical protein I552_3458 [Mycobacterium xenopi 3993]|nr:hypothetical protein I552_3458 [Mycobacterium xenopi 3993]